MYDLQLDMRAAILQQLLCHGAAQTNRLQLHLGPIRGVIHCTGVRRFEEQIDLPGRGWSPRRSLSSEHLHEILISCIHTFIHWDIFTLPTCQHANIHTYMHTYVHTIPCSLSDCFLIGAGGQVTRTRSVWCRALQENLPNINKYYVRNHFLCRLRGPTSVLPWSSSDLTAHTYIQFEV